jgi:hypothetical protein
VSVADGRDGGHSQVLQFDDFLLLLLLLLLVRHRSGWCYRRSISCCGYDDGFFEPAGRFDTTYVSEETVFGRLVLLLSLKNFFYIISVMFDLKGVFLAKYFILKYV